MSKPQPDKPKHEEGTWRSPLPTEDEAPHRLRMSTQALPKRDRFEVFRENFSQYLYRAEVRNRSEGIFDGRIEQLKAGSVGISRIAACPSTYTRTRRHVSDSDDALTLFVGINNGLALEQAGISQQFRHGNGFLYHGAIPGAAEATAPIGLWGIEVAAGRITSRLAPGCSLKPMSIPAELPAMKLITQYLNAYATVASSPDGDVREAFGTHLTDLLMLIIGPDRDSLELIKGRGLEAARTDAVLKSLGRDFASPDLSAERIGLSLGITARQVHRLLEETTKTFYEHVLERRLIESHWLLTDPNCGTSTWPRSRVARDLSTALISIASFVSGLVRRRQTCAQLCAREYRAFCSSFAEAVVDINLKQPKAARPRSRPLGFLH